MKLFVNFFLFTNMFFGHIIFCHTYEQHNQIVVYAENSHSDIYKSLDKFGLNYTKVQRLPSVNDKNLTIISGKLSSLARLSLPRYYILHQTEALVGNPNQEQLKVLSGAVAVWDCSQSNIDKYSISIKNYYYVPNENYEFLDPVILPCFLPLNALPSYKKMLEYSNSQNSDISRHIPSLFCHCVFQNPAIIVEAGVRWGDGSTKPMHAATLLTGAHMIGIDIDDCSRVYASLSNTTFVRMSDLDFTGYFLKTFGQKEKMIDFVFIDTSHQTEHTVKEIECFNSLLSECGALGFHDTCPIPGDPRGALDGVKKYFNLNFDETKYFSGVIERNGRHWSIIHYPFNNGMTIIKRLAV